MKKEFSKIKRISGELSFGGDKSVSHRAVIFAGMADGRSRLTNLSSSDDVKSTIECMAALGVKFETDSSVLTVVGNGINGLREPKNDLYSGNSGTTARLLSGVLARQKFSTILTGDSSLSERPMKRIVDPLTEMGARFECSPKCTLPITIFPAENPRAIQYKMPVPSAQVKSAVLLAGLFGEEATSVIENLPSRDHTERMLNLPVEEAEGGLKISASQKYYPTAREYDIPGDVSSAAFFIVAALIADGSELMIRNVLLNEGRTGFIEVLQEMGSLFKFEEFKLLSNEFAGNIIVRQCGLKNVNIPKEKIPSIIDEAPILAVAGLFAEGDFVLRNAGELRVKETDRINAVCRNMELLGLDVEEFDDGFRIGGSIKNRSVTFNSYGDHRIAMAFSVLSAILGGCAVDSFESVSVSNPEFAEMFESVSEL